MASNQTKMFNYKQLKPHTLVSLSKIRSLVPKTIEANAITDKENNSLLQQCLIHGCCKSILKYLVNSGALVNHQNISGETALHLACKLNNHNFIKILLMLNTDVEIKERNGLTVMDIANKMHDLKAVEIILKHTVVKPYHDTIITCLKSACCSDNSKDIQSFLKKVEYLNDIVEPLHMVCSLNGPGSIPIISHYLENGARINSVNKEGLSALHVACKRQASTDVVKYLLSKRASVNKQDNTGQTSLFYCLDNPNPVATELMMLLVQHKADPTMVNKNGETALINALHKYPNKIAQFLSVFEDSKCTLRNLEYHKKYQTKSYICYRYYASNVTLYCFGHDPKFGDINKKFTEGNTYLHYACLYNAHKFTEFLIKEQMADVNCKNAEGKTPLHLAALKDNAIVCHVLCSNKSIDLKVKDINNETALVTALREGSQQVLEVMMCMMERAVLENSTILLPCMQNVQGNTFLHYTVLVNQFLWTEYALHQQCKDFCCVNIPNNDGNIPLHLACIRDQCDNGCLKFWYNSSSRYNSLRGKPGITSKIIQCLLNAKSDINAKNNDGFTPLTCAFMTANTPVFRILADYINNHPDTDYSQILGNIKNSINAKNQNGNTILIEAFYYNKSASLVKAILQMGADYTIPNRDGSLPLHIAVYNMNKEFIDILLKHGENINRIYQENKNALYVLCDRKEKPTEEHEDMVKYLVDKGIYIQQSNTAESCILNPLIVTVFRHSDLLTDALLKYGANPNVLVNDEPLLHYALKKSNFKCVSLLLHYGADIRYTNRYGLTALDVFLADRYRLTASEKADQNNTLILLVSAGGVVNSRRDITVINNANAKLYTVLPSLHLMNVNVLPNSRISIPYFDKTNNDIRKDGISLTQHCAKVIRTTLKPNALVGVSHLPIPKSFQELITLNYGI